MGKIRVRTIGDEKAEKQQAIEAKKRAEAKRAEKTVTAETAKAAEPQKPLSDSNVPVKPSGTDTKPKSKYSAKKNKSNRSAK